MSLAVQNIINQVNLYVRQDPVRSYQNMRLNSILLQILGLLNTLSSSGITVSSGVLRITGANFINATDCPLIALNGMNLAVFFDDRSNYLKPSIDMTPLVGGGFKVLIPGFDATAGNLNSIFYVSIQDN